MNALVRSSATGVICAGLLGLWAAAASSAERARRVLVMGPDGKVKKASPGAKSADKEVALSFKDSPMDAISKFLSEHRGKPVIQHESLKTKKITIVSTKKMPLSDALDILEAALREGGMIIEEYPSFIAIKPIEEAKQSLLEVVPADRSVSSMPHKERIVDKIFRIEHYDVERIKDIIQPMLPSYAHLTADPNTRTLVITDTVAHLERIERIIAALDVPTADQTVTKIFKLKDGDASEIVSMLRTLIEGKLGKHLKKVTAAPGAAKPPSRPDPRSRMRSMIAMGGRPSRPPSGSKKPKGAEGAGTVFIKPSKYPVILEVEVTRNWIIAVAPPSIMELIEHWIEEFDVPSKVPETFEIYAVKHADIVEVSRQITQTIDSLPNEEIKKSIRVVPFENSRRLLVLGSDQGRQFVKDLLEKLDVEDAEHTVMRTFVLENADAEAVADAIDQLFEPRRYVSYQSSWGSRQYQQDRSGRVPYVKVIADARRNTVTVMTDVDTLAEIEEMIITDLDSPIDVSEIEPKIYNLKHADPLQVKDVLDEMFSKKRQTSSFDFFFRSSTETVPVGRLFGQFAFQALPNSNKLIVTTKNKNNYIVIDRLIEQLDEPQEAGLPTVIELKHANAEDLCERLNALLAETGTMAEILRSEREFKRRTEREQEQQRSGQQAQRGADQGQASTREMMRFWWQRARLTRDERPSSNLIGKIRFVPVQRRNALMVLAPQAYLDPIKEMVEILDQPGLQVIIHAVLAEIQHDDDTTLGIRLASDPSIFQEARLFDSSIRGDAAVKRHENSGGFITIVDETGTSQTVARGVFNATVNVFGLVQFLRKTLDMKILFEPTLHTADNQESEFFDGQEIPFQTRSQSSPEATSVTREIDYRDTGTRLRVRPHITKDGDVDLWVNLEVSRIVPGEIVLENPVFDRRETFTHVILKSGQTVMLSGNIRQEEFEEVRKWPILGDIPLLGLLFRSIDTVKANRELVTFITPYVIGEGMPETDIKLKEYQKKLERLRESIRGPERDTEAD